MNKALLSSNKDDWCTPQALFEELDREFHFDLDAAASDDNAKCKRYFTKETDGLHNSWGGGGTVFCNPPYGRKVIHWVRKAAQEAEKGATVVMLIAARTDTIFFHDYIYKKSNVEIRFIKGRIKFTDKNGNGGAPAPFPSMVVIFRPPKGAKQ